jgi:allophanate hydrolase
VIAPAFADRVAADVARLISGGGAGGGPGGESFGGPVGIGLVVVGAHLSDQPLNRQLTSRGARFVGPVSTSADYAMYLLATEPPKPGLVRVGEGGRTIEAELWAVPPVGLASFLAELPSPMALGTVRLSDGSCHVGFLVEPIATAGARDISAYGGWRNFLRSAVASAESLLR